MSTLPLTLDTLQTTAGNGTSPLMSPQCLKTILADSSSNASNEMDEIPERPTNLKLDASQQQQLQQQQQQQHSIITPSSALAIGNISPALSSAGSLSPSFLPEMPQWKRDLIQRRKQNVQRTISASSPTSSPSSATGLSSSPTSVLLVAAAATGGSGGLKTSTSSSSVRSLAGSNTNIDQLASDGYLPQICSTKDFTKTKLKPATTTTTTTLNSPLKEKTEKLFGGQYTATTPTTTNITATTQHLLTKEEEITFNTLQLCKEDKEEAEQQQQQQQKLHMAASLTGSIHNLNSINNTTTCVVNNMSEHLKRDSYESSNKESELMSVEQSCKLNNSSNMSVNKQNVKQCLNKCDAERLQGAVNLINITGNNTNLNNLLSHNNLNKTIGVNCNNNSGGVVCGGNNSVNVVNKISQKLQENQFIKNEQQQQQHQQYLGNNNKKFIKYKQTTLDLKSPTKIPSKSLLTTSNSANCLSTTTANQKKMVAVQEMKKTTQTKSIIASNCQASNRNSSRAGSGGGGGGVYTENSSGGDLDNPEDLSYGPGIVSKLRCRYLSLALRESMEQQRLNKDQLMRRSTSLNNLLDNCEDEDEEEEEEEEEEELEHNLQVTEEEGEEEGGERTKTKEIIKPRQKMGILKSSGNNTNASKRFSSPNQGSNGVGVTFTETSLYHQRSRHLKRGNDSLKRARSVEALLSEKSPWFSRHNATAATGTNSSVTIEDKIHNARERLQQGLEHMPPKRITSIIDDTERPPPDLVKQTLKMFEASANRRPRNQLNNNVKGEVASKVETFKNIIKEQKPTITYPKPLSPSKKLNTPLKSTNKATDLMQTPSGRKTLLISSPLNSESPKLNNLSEHTPDIIPRNKFTAGSSTKKEISCFKTNQREFINKEKQEIMIVDSPITALSKELSKMRINNDNEINSGELKGKHILSDSDERNEQKEEEKEEKEEQKQQQHQDIASGDACQQQQQQKQQVLNSLKPESVANKINNKNNEVNANASALVSAAATAAIATTKENASELTTKSIQQLETKINNYDSLIKTSHNNVTTIAATSLTPTTPPTNTTNSTKYNNKELFAKSEEKSENNIHELDGDNDDDDDDKDDDENLTTKRITRKALDNIAKAGYTQQFKFNSTNTTSTTSSSTSSPLNSGKQIGVIKPLLQQQPASPSPPPPTIPQKSSEMDSLKHTSSPSLTSREIEKNRINDMKKSNNTSSPSTTTSSSLNANTSSPVPNAAGGFSDVDSVISATNSPLWAMRKRRQAPPAAPPENTSMVFNFSNRKEVPDYIENDGVIFRRKRELPKPNESGFVLLGDLSVETSTDMDYDDFSMCPPSPCDVEFVNANIVIDGKSSIRQKSKDTTFRVQFNDTLTSTFEYPSEASLIVDDSFSSYNEGYTQPHDADDFTQTFQNMCLESAAAAASQQHQHHVADEIIQLPPTTPAAASQTTPTKNILGNLPLDYPDLQKGIQLNTQQQQSITETIKTTTATVEELEIKTPEEIKKSRKELKLPLTQKPPLPVKRFLMKNNPVAVGTAPATHMAAPKFLYTKNLNKNLEKCEEIRRETKKISVELSQSIVKNCDLELPPKPKLELPKILNKPQYACFLKETNSNTFKSPIMRSRSNEFQKSFTINVARSSSLRNLEASKQEAAAIGVNNSASPSSAANYFPTEVNFQNINTTNNLAKNVDILNSSKQLTSSISCPLIKIDSPQNKGNLGFKGQNFRETLEQLKKSLQQTNNPIKFLENTKELSENKVKDLISKLPCNNSILDSTNPLATQGNEVNTFTTSLVAFPTKSLLEEEKTATKAMNNIKGDLNSKFPCSMATLDTTNPLATQSNDTNSDNSHLFKFSLNTSNKQDHNLTTFDTIKSKATLKDTEGSSPSNLVSLCLKSLNKLENFQEKSQNLLNQEKSLKLPKTFNTFKPMATLENVESKNPPKLALLCFKSLNKSETTQKLLNEQNSVKSLQIFNSNKEIPTEYSKNTLDFPKTTTTNSSKTLTSLENYEKFKETKLKAFSLEPLNDHGNRSKKSNIVETPIKSFENSSQATENFYSLKESQSKPLKMPKSSSGSEIYSQKELHSSYDNLQHMATLEKRKPETKINLSASCLNHLNNPEEMPKTVPEIPKNTQQFLNQSQSECISSSVNLQPLTSLEFKKIINSENLATSSLDSLNNSEENSKKSPQIPKNTLTFLNQSQNVSIFSSGHLKHVTALDNRINAFDINLSALSSDSLKETENIAENSSETIGEKQNSLEIEPDLLNTKLLNSSQSLSSCSYLKHLACLENKEKFTDNKVATLTFKNSQNLYQNSLIKNNVNSTDFTISLENRNLLRSANRVATLAYEPVAIDMNLSSKAEGCESVINENFLKSARPEDFQDYKESIETKHLETLSMENNLAAHSLKQDEIENEIRSETKSKGNFCKSVKPEASSDIKDFIKPETISLETNLAALSLKSLKKEESGNEKRSQKELKENFMKKVKPEASSNYEDFIESKALPSLSSDTNLAALFLKSLKNEENEEENSFYDENITKLTKPKCEVFNEAKHLAALPLDTNLAALSVKFLKKEENLKKDCSQIELDKNIARFSQPEASLSCKESIKSENLAALPLEESMAILALNSLQQDVNENLSNSLKNMASLDYNNKFMNRNLAALSSEDLNKANKLQNSLEFNAETNNSLKQLKRERSFDCEALDSVTNLAAHSGDCLDKKDDLITNLNGNFTEFELKFREIRGKVKGFEDKNFNLNKIKENGEEMKEREEEILKLKNQLNENQDSVVKTLKKFRASEGITIQNLNESENSKETRDNFEAPENSLKSFQNELESVDLKLDFITNKNSSNWNKSAAKSQDFDKNTKQTPYKSLKRLSLTINPTYLTDYKSQITQNFNLKAETLKTQTFVYDNSTATPKEHRTNSQPSLSLTHNEHNFFKCYREMRVNLSNKRETFKSKSLENLREIKENLILKEKAISYENIKDLKEYSLYRERKQRKDIKDYKNEENRSKVNRKLREKLSKSLDDLRNVINSEKLTNLLTRSLDNVHLTDKTLKTKCDSCNLITQLGLQNVNESKDCLNPQRSFDSMEVYEDAQDLEIKDLEVFNYLEDLNKDLTYLTDDQSQNIYETLSLKKSKTSFCLQNLEKSFSLESTTNSEDNFVSACNTLESKWSQKPKEKPATSNPQASSANPPKKLKTFRVKTQEKFLNFTQMASQNVSSYATFRKSKNFCKNASKSLKNSLKFYENFQENSPMKRSISLTENALKRAELNRKIFAKSEKLMRKVRNLEDEESPTENSNSFEYIEPKEEEKISPHNNNERLEIIQGNKIKYKYAKDSVTDSNKNLISDSVSENSETKNVSNGNFLDLENSLESYSQENVLEIDKDFNLIHSKPVATLQSPQNLAALCLNSLILKNEMNSQHKSDNSHKTLRSTNYMASLACENYDIDTNLAALFPKSLNFKENGSANDSLTELNENLNKSAAQVATLGYKESNKVKNLAALSLQQNLTSRSLQTLNHKENESENAFHKGFRENLQNSAKHMASLDYRETNNNRNLSTLSTDENLAALSFDSLNKREILQNTFQTKCQIHNSFQQFENLASLDYRPYDSEGNLTALSGETFKNNEIELEYRFNQKLNENLSKTFKNVASLHCKDDNNRNVATLSRETFNKEEHENEINSLQELKESLPKSSKREEFSYQEFVNKQETVEETSFPTELKKSPMSLDYNQIVCDGNPATSYPKYLNKLENFQKIAQPSKSFKKLKRLTSLDYESIPDHRNWAALAPQYLKNEGFHLEDLNKIEILSDSPKEDSINETCNTNFRLPWEFKNDKMKRLASLEQEINDIDKNLAALYGEIPNKPVKCEESLNKPETLQVSSNFYFNSSPRPYKRLHRDTFKSEKEKQEESLIKTGKMSEISKSLSNLKPYETFEESVSLKYLTSSCESPNKPRLPCNNRKYNVYTSTPTKSQKPKISPQDISPVRERFNFTPSVKTSLTISSVFETIKEAEPINSMKAFQIFDSFQDLKPKFSDNYQENSQMKESDLSLTNSLKYIEKEKIIKDYEEIPFGTTNLLNNSTKFPNNNEKFPQNFPKCSQDFETFENSSNALKLKENNKINKDFNPTTSVLSKSTSTTLKFPDNNTKLPENTQKSRKNSQDFESTLNYQKLTKNNCFSKDSNQIPNNLWETFENLSEIPETFPKIPQNSFKFSDTNQTINNSKDLKYSTERSLNNIKASSISLDISERSSKSQGVATKSLPKTQTSDIHQILPNFALNSQDLEEITLGSSNSHHNEPKLPDSLLKSAGNILRSLTNSQIPGVSDFSSNLTIKSNQLKEIPSIYSNLSSKASKLPVRLLKFSGNSLKSLDNSQTMENSKNFHNSSTFALNSKDLREIPLSSSSLHLNEPKLPDGLLNSFGNSFKSFDNSQPLEISKNFPVSSSFALNSKDIGEISLSSSDSQLNPAKLPDSSLRSCGDTLKSLDYIQNSKISKSFLDLRKFALNSDDLEENYLSSLNLPFKPSKLSDSSFKLFGNSLKFPDNYQTSENQGNSNLKCVAYSQTLFDSSVERSMSKSSPLPPPKVDIRLKKHLCFTPVGEATNSCQVRTLICDDFQENSSNIEKDSVSQTPKMNAKMETFVRNSNSCQFSFDLSKYSQNSPKNPNNSLETEKPSTLGEKFSEYSQIKGNSLIFREEDRKSPNNFKNFRQKEVKYPTNTHLKENSLKFLEYIPKYPINCQIQVNPLSYRENCSNSLNNFQLQEKSVPKIVSNSQISKVPNFNENTAYQVETFVREINDTQFSFNLVRFSHNSPKFPDDSPIKQKLQKLENQGSELDNFLLECKNYNNDYLFANKYPLQTPLEELLEDNAAPLNTTEHNNTFNSASPQLLKNSPHLKLQTIRKPFNDNLNNKTPNTTTATTIINNKTNTTTTATTTTTTSTTTLWANKTHTVKDFTNFSTEVVALTNTTTTNNSLKNSAYTSSPSFLSSSTSACKQLLATAKYQQTATTTKTSPPLFSTSPQTPLKSTPPTVLPRSVFNKKTTTTMTTTIPTTISLKSSSTSTTTSSTKLCSSSSSSNTSTTTSCLTSANIINTKAPPLPPLRRRSAPLGFYTPLKAPIDRLFQLGVTRAPSLMNNLESPTTESATANGINRLYNGISSLGKHSHNGDDDNGDGGNGSIVGISGGLIQHDDDDDYGNKNKKNFVKHTNDDEAESLQYIKPADDDLNIAYSEGTQKTDLLY